MPSTQLVMFPEALRGAVYASAYERGAPGVASERCMGRCGIATYAICPRCLGACCPMCREDHECRGR